MFTWTDPNPLVKATPMLAIYISELQDGVNSVRNIIGRTNYSFSDSSGIFLLNHYTELGSTIDELITDFGYPSVVDILGRGWAVLPTLWLPNNWGYALLQDFRDVLDAIQSALEQWRRLETTRPKLISTAPDSYGTTFTYEITGDLGLYENCAIRDYTRYTYSWAGYSFDKSIDASVNLDYIRDGNDSKLIFEGKGDFITDIQQNGIYYPYFAMPYTPGFDLLKILDDNNLTLKDGYLLKLKIDMSGTSPNLIINGFDYYPSLPLLLQFGLTIIFQLSLYTRIYLHFAWNSRVSSSSGGYQITESSTGNYYVNFDAYPFTNTDVTLDILSILRAITENPTETFKINSIQYTMDFAGISTSYQLDEDSPIIEGNAGNYKIEIDKVGLIKI